MYWIHQVLVWLFHDKMKWHTPDGVQSFDGCSTSSHCIHCGKKILQDSQGDWF